MFGASYELWILLALHQMHLPLYHPC
jgi:hypothetical protein